MPTLKDLDFPKPVDFRLHIEKYRVDCKDSRKAEGFAAGHLGAFSEQVVKRALKYGLEKGRGAWWTCTEEEMEACLCRAIDDKDHNSMLVFAAMLAFIVMCNSEEAKTCP